MKIWHAEYTSTSFFFDAFGATEHEARQALLDGLEKHAYTYKLPERWFDPDDVTVQERELGCAYRDRELI